MHEAHCWLLPSPWAAPPQPWSRRQATTQAVDPRTDRTADSIAAARANAREHAGVGAAQGLVVRDTVLDADGASHVRFDRTYRGLEVVGGDFVVHQAKGGAFRSTPAARSPAASSWRPRPPCPAAGPPPRPPRTVDFAKTRPPRAGRPRRGPRPGAGLAGRRRPAATPTARPPASTSSSTPAAARSSTSWPSVLEETGSGTGLFVGTVPLETTLSGSTYSLVDADPRRQRDPQRPLRQQRAAVHRRRQRLGHRHQRRPRRPPASTPTTASPRPGTSTRTPTAATASPTTARAPAPFVHDGAYVNASWSDACFCMPTATATARRTRRWSSSTSPATR